MSELEDDARRIAERGREALIDRLREAFREAVEAHRGEARLEDPELEQMIQRAADEADGLQWRRALAAVAMDELGLKLGEAVDHPAVARAHEIVGAPSYEDAVAGLGVPLEAPAEALRPAESWTTEGRRDARSESPLQLTCTHLGGIADLASPEAGVELWFSEHGLDIVRATQEPLGRLRWDELRAIEIVDARARFMPRRAPHTYLVIRGTQGDASFEVAQSSAVEVRDRLANFADDKIRIA